MPKPRKALITIEETPYYHCVSRCVRRAFLCGSDPSSGRSYEHRRQWILDRLIELTQSFAIDCAGFSLMSNHYHLMLYVDRDEAQRWDTDEIVKRWQSLFKGSLLADRYLSSDKLSRAERHVLDHLVDQWHSRLSNISWFMRCLNEFVARKANQEDHCTGRYWEGRFKSQALLDEKALAACLVYVDLNPIRAKMAIIPETSDYTSISQRLSCISAQHEGAGEQMNLDQPPNLLPFVGNPRQVMPKGVTL